MQEFSVRILSAAALLAGGMVSSAGFASSADLEQAVSLLRDTRADRCQQSSLRSKLLVAHRSHDEKTVNEFYPQLEALNAKMKPAEDKLKALQAVIRLNSEENSAFETAQLEYGSCE